MMEFVGKIESQRPTNPSNVKHQVVSGRFMYTQNTHKKVGRSSERQGYRRRRRQADYTEQ